MNNRTSIVVQGALIGALYIILTVISNMFGLASGVIQIRLSEALTILPIFTPAAIPGLFVGCLISNIITGCMPLDVIFGALATLIGAYGTYLLRKRRMLASIPPILANTIIVPWILSLVYSFEGSIWYFTLTVFIG
ncbi:MAG: QueT transporter family protein, partial [Clostridia bacterium]|nr:QueT transporter family protein [Clostridia bacterium]